jgi:uncharacterized CHY-type Zn-finger protein
MDLPLVICGRCNVEMTILRPTGSRVCPTCGGVAADVPKPAPPQP